ncbi:hypothetical protein F1188_00070 [Roseospira marina]|uniref:Uncharacterized protein n=1 Tax=Roseospira marina TaxID=140057 RepID=A0A5M6IG67_9PROT|nr:hypothetical protein [Roseospira marina]KAA5607204.1 hypothetical protein F1188_00070 [Roseospira marina]MBB4312646.1 hypothetical protein [Roseospira marina]MBB5085338.1 hypothetical protein [Roseospira marina]
MLNNTVPAGGPTLQVDPTTGPANIAQLTAGFSEAEAAVVEQSLAWYGTESRFALSRLQGSTARDLVDVVNCLKQDEGGPEEERCFK